MKTLTVRRLLLYLTYMLRSNLIHFIVYKQLSTRILSTDYVFVYNIFSSVNQFTYFFSLDIFSSDIKELL